MKKNYLRTLIVMLLFGNSWNMLNAQCSTPAPPSVSGSTIAGCVNSSAFTLTGTPSGTNLIGWYANSFGGNALSTNSIFTTPSLTSGATYYVGQSTATSFNDTLSLPTHSTVLTTAQTRGFWFVSPVDFIITGLRVPVVIGGTLSGIAVVKFPVAPPLYASYTNTFSTLYLDQAITGTNVVSVNIPVYAGDIIGILGERGGFGSYGPTTNPFLATLGVGTTTINLHRLGMLYDLSTTAPTELWTETTNSIGRVEVYATQSCNSTLTPVTVTVIPVPQVTVAPPPVICANTSYTLNASGAVTYTWSGGPQTSTYVVAPSTTTTYSVQGSILSNCNSSLSTITVSVDQGIPTLTATSSSSVVCSGDTLTLNGYGAASYTWAGGANSVTNNVGFVPIATQQYTLYGENSCGVNSTMITVNVNPTPTLMTTSTPTAVCDGHSATLTVSGASTYSWEPAAAAGATVVVTPTISTLYNVSGVSAAGCPATAAQVVVVVPVPTVVIGSVAHKTLVCPGGSATLTSSGADTYSWTSSALTSTYLINPTSSQVYTVTGTNTLTQCYATNTIAINVFSPTLSLTSNTSVCYGASITLTANAGTGSTYLWSNNIPNANANITVTTTASYSVTAQTPTTGALKCSSTGSVLVSLFPNPTVQIVSTRTAICKGEKTTLTASGGTSFVWAGQAPTTASIQVSPINMTFPTVYSVTAKDLNGCQGSGTISVKVSACTAIDELEKGADLIAVYPNPNSGEFMVQVKGELNLSLINELGQVIKELSFTQENQYQQHILGLSSGIYFIRGVHNGSTIQSKLVVTK